MDDIKFMRRALELAQLAEGALLGISTYLAIRDQ